jgi:hypothetical protein
LFGYFWEVQLIHRKNVEIYQKEVFYECCVSSSTVGKNLQETTK